MKLLVAIADNQWLVDWDKNLSEFPNVVQFGGKYFQHVMWEDDKTGVAHKLLHFSEMSPHAIPVNMFGVPFPVPDFNQFIVYNLNLICECGAEKTYGPNTSHVSWCPKWRKQ